MAVLIIALVLIVYAYISTNNLFPAAFSFQNSFNELNNVWLSNGIDATQLESKPIGQVSLTQLNAIGTGITRFQSTLPESSSNEVDAMQKLSLIHLDLVSLLKEKKQLGTKILALPNVASLSGEELCSQIDSRKQLQTDIQSIYNSAATLEGKLSAFSSSYSDLVSASYIESLSPNADAINEESGNFSSSLNDLELWCA